MGASVRPREFDSDPSRTEQLANWITKVRTKKIVCQRNRKRNLRVEAVLTSVLYKAETDLRIKQVTRIQKWQQMRQQLLGDVNYQNGGFDCDLNHRRKNDIQCNDDVNTINYNYYRSNNEHFNDIWSTPELRSFNLFMTQLSEIKIPLQR